MGCEIPIAGDSGKRFRMLDRHAVHALVRAQTMARAIAEQLMLSVRTVGRNMRWSQPRRPR